MLCSFQSLIKYLLDSNVSYFADNIVTNPSTSFGR